MKKLLTIVAVLVLFVGFNLNAFAVNEQQLATIAARDSEHLAINIASFYQIRPDATTDEIVNVAVMPVFNDSKMIQYLTFDQIKVYCKVLGAMAGAEWMELKQGKVTPSYIQQHPAEYVKNHLLPVLRKLEDQGVFDY